MKSLILFLSVFCSITLAGQKRLELLETNISSDKFSQFADSYLWTKNWWLVNRKIVDTAKGGNALSKESKLDKAKIDSLSLVFSRYLTSEIMRFGKLNPRIYLKIDKKLRPYIKASIYEFDNSEVKLVGLFIIEFGSDFHNSMADVLNIIIIDPNDAITYSNSQVKSWYERPSSRLERNMTQP